ncbi:hypothetical protein [Tunturiibacter gelidoferens]|uniref:Twin-arginine translocation signal domain-containing protein n=1 Tax=Tunturiibacter gelidiferens TaxID=3069689 RepID=A0A9X0QH35_9BACT|nr:hypothetical protein [Edaphobacter lichenicola]MBB5330303.1 hypothetical protein [Edaphobacter lichenicola]
MTMLERRDFLKLLASAGAASAFEAGFAFGFEGKPLTPGTYAPGRIPNEFSLLLPGEREALKNAPTVSAIANEDVTAKAGGHTGHLKPGDALDGWMLITIVDMNGVETAVFEKHVTHRGAIAYVTAERGTIACIPKQIGDLSKIRPRPTNTPDGVKLERTAQYIPGPDAAGLYLLQSTEDPCYENVAALGAEYIGWTLVANEQGGPKASLYLEPDGSSRRPAQSASADEVWAPDELGAYFDPAELLAGDGPQLYKYKAGWSKRTLLGGYLPVADIGVWNSDHGCGYETMVLLPAGVDAKPMGRVRSMIPEIEVTRHAGRRELLKGTDGRSYLDRYWNCSPQSFYVALAGIWNRWSSLYESTMPIEIPDEWLLNAARAGITLSRCSYRGLEPTYQIGEGGYTKIPERSHALFPVAHYEFIWALQLWGLTDDADSYFQNYLEKYVLPNGDFLYNTQDQVEGPLNIGIFLANSARSFDYKRNLQSLELRLPILERMIGFVLKRYEDSKRHFASTDRRYGLIYGSPEADLGDPNNDFPASHPFYYQNSVCVWRGLKEHARCLRLAAEAKKSDTLRAASERYEAIASEMRGNIQRSLEATLTLRAADMRAAGITPFTPDDIDHRPTELSSYENHRFMQDWFLADWGDPALDIGHLRHRELAGMQIVGLHTDGAVARTSNFMDHGSLSVKIRQEDYRPFLLNLYALVCYAGDSGNFYAPEDAWIPGSYAGEGSRYGWSAVVNSTLQPTVGLRWLLCYEETDVIRCHLQKAAPRHWFAKGQRISVANCPTKFGLITWMTEAESGGGWRVTVEVSPGFSGDIVVHIHSPSAKELHTTSMGSIEGSAILLPASSFAINSKVVINVT